MKNTFEAKLYQLKVEREALLTIFKSLGITHIDGNNVEVMKNIDMKNFIIDNMRTDLSLSLIATASNQ